MKPSFIVGNLLHKDALPRDVFVGGLLFPFLFSTYLAWMPYLKEYARTQARQEKEQPSRNVRMKKRIMLIQDEADELPLTEGSDG